MPQKETNKINHRTGQSFSFLSQRDLMSLFQILFFLKWRKTLRSAGLKALIYSNLLSSTHKGSYETGRKRCLHEGRAMSTKHCAPWSEGNHVVRCAVRLTYMSYFSLPLPDSLFLSPTFRPSPSPSLTVVVVGRNWPGTNFEVSSFFFNKLIIPRKKSVPLRHRWAVSEP